MVFTLVIAEPAYVTPVVLSAATVMKCPSKRMRLLPVQVCDHVFEVAEENALPVSMKASVAIAISFNT